MLLPQEIRERISSFQRKLSSTKIKAKFVEKENLHLCLSFLGEISESKLEKIEKKLREVCKDYGKLRVKVSGLLLIPSEKFVRVIALGIKDSEELERLRISIAEKVGGDSKPLHITLCRVKSIEDKSAFSGFASSYRNVSLGEFVFDRVQVIKSTLTFKGPVYEVLREVTL